jgi:hypothetical protein
MANHRIGGRTGAGALGCGCCPAAARALGPAPLAASAPGRGGGGGIQALRQGLPVPLQQRTILRLRLKGNKKKHAD